MTAVREDPVTGDRVVVAPGRAARPDRFRAPTDGRRGGAGGDRRGPPNCPFCPGHERETPPELARTGSGAPDTPGWRVRVVPNLYPIVAGAHEVAVLSPAHDRGLADLADDQVRELFRVLRDRARVQLASGRAHVQVFVNHGREAGASIEHPHAQLVGLDAVPPRVEALLGRFERAGRDLVVDDLAQARQQALVLAEEPVPLWSPAAASGPFALRCALGRAMRSFEEAGDDEVGALAVTVRDALRLLAGELGDFSYNVVVNSAPRAGAGRFHSWVDVLPRLAVRAGFELGTGVLVNPVAPADAVRTLRA